MRKAISDHFIKMFLLAAAIGAFGYGNAVAANFVLFLIWGVCLPTVALALTDPMIQATALQPPAPPFERRARLLFGFTLLFVLIWHGWLFTAGAWLVFLLAGHLHRAMVDERRAKGKA